MLRKASSLIKSCIALLIISLLLSGCISNDTEVSPSLPGSEKENQSLTEQNAVSDNTEGSDLTKTDPQETALEENSTDESITEASTTAETTVAETTEEETATRESTDENAATDESSTEKTSENECNHNYSDTVETVNPTCTESGYKKEKCSLCDDIKTTVLKSTGHTPIPLPGKAPTCTESGLSNGKQCSVCKTVLQAQSVLQIVDHEYVDGICKFCQKAQTNDSDYTDVTLYDSEYFYNYLGTVTKGNKYQQFYNEIDLQARKFHNENIDAQPKPFSDGTTYYYFTSLNYSALGLTVDEASDILQLYIYDHPLYYWFNGSSFYTSQTISLCVYGEYSDGDVRAQINKLIYDGIKSIIESVDPNQSAYTLALAYHDIICSMTEYSYEADGITPRNDEWAHNIVGLFDGRGSVCEGYTEAFSLLLNFSNVENTLVAGPGHIWNLVCLDDGYWYWCDVTWDDTPELELGISYNYFCVNDSQNVYLYYNDGGKIQNEIQTFPSTHPIQWENVYVIDMSDVLPTRNSGVYSANDVSLRETFEVDGMIYTLIGYRTVQLVYVNKQGDITVPEKITYMGVDYDVVAIGGIDEKGVIGWKSILTSGVRSISIPKSVTYVWGQALVCSTLESVTFSPDSEGLIISRYALYDTPKLTHISLPVNISEIGERALYGAFALREISYSGTVAQWQAINKHEDWSYALRNCAVKCRDGSILIQ